MLNRNKLDELIRTDGGVNWWNPDLFVERILPLLPPEIEVIKNPPQESSNYNCFIYALGLSDDLDLIKDCDGFIYESLIRKFIEERVLSYTETPSEGDYVLYLDDDKEMHHLGIVNSDNTITSKWSWGPLIKHEIWDVPACYGNKIKYLKYIEPDQVKKYYYQYKNFNINMSEIILDVPLMNQPKNSPHCAVACARMLMAYYGKSFTHEDLLRNFPEIDKTQAGMAPASACLMAQEGFDVEYYTNEDLVRDVKDGDEQSLETYKKLIEYLPPDSNHQRRWREVIKFIEAGGKFIAKVLTLDDLDSFLKRGIPVRVGVRGKIFYSQPENTQNHSVVIRGMKGDEYYINDPAPRFTEPYWMKKDKLLEAWRANGSIAVVAIKNK